MPRTPRAPRTDATEVLIQVKAPRTLQRAIRIYAAERESSISAVSAELLMEAMRSLHRWPTAEGAERQPFAG